MQIIHIQALTCGGPKQTAACLTQAGMLLPRIEIGCRFPLDKEVGDSLSSFKKIRSPFQPLLFNNKYAKKIIKNFLVYLLQKKQGLKWSSEFLTTKQTISNFFI